MLRTRISWPASFRFCGKLQFAPGPSQGSCYPRCVVVQEPRQTRVSLSIGRVHAARGLWSIAVLGVGEPVSQSAQGGRVLGQLRKPSKAQRTTTEADMATPSGVDQLLQLTEVI